jgi:2-oxoglutarate dehydrogenase E2 component (dihydrolipoamide succinyltransferase)
VLQILVPEGETVERGVLLALIGDANEVGVATGYPSAPVSTAHSRAEPVGSSKSLQNGGSLQTGQRVTPVVARMLAEHQLDLNQIAGTGNGGRVTKKDVEAYLAARSGLTRTAEEVPPWEQPVEGDLFKPTGEIFAKANEGKTAPPAAPKPMPVVPATPAPRPTVPTSGEVVVPPDAELVPISNIRRSIAEHMVRSKLQTSPHVTTVFEVDLSAIIAHQSANMEAFAKQGLKLTLTAYFVLAAVEALKAYPWVNAQWTDKGVLLHKSYNIGMAVAIPDGLIVPVIRNAGDLSLTGVVRQVNDLAKRAREKALRPDEITGGTFTITNHGVSGSLFATPIINQPQAAILGTGAMQKRVVVISDARGDTLAIRPMIYATLTFDHRLIDGAAGDGFLSVFKKTLENWAL